MLKLIFYLAIFFFFRLLQKLKEDISVFLCLERIENLKVEDKIFYEWDFDPWSSSSGISENQESDNEMQENDSGQQESQFHYGNNIKIIKGVL